MIPPIAHIIWLGARLPWICGLSVESALRHGDFQQVVLHHDSAVDLGPWRARWHSEPRLVMRRIDPSSVFEGQSVARFDLLRIYRRLVSPAGRVNVLRAAILAEEGGVYLDTDTVTLSSLSPMRSAGFFCGTEPVAFPAGSVSFRHPAALGRGILLHVLRAGCASAPGGYRWFRRLERHYDQAANNAVLGSEPNHPFALRLLQKMTDLPEERLKVRFALGTHLLQKSLKDSREPGVVVHPPAVFYPLGPEISRQWFRRAPGVRPGALLLPETRVVHWYASVRVRSIADAMDPTFVSQHVRDIPFCGLVEHLVDVPKSPSPHAPSEVTLGVETGGSGGSRRTA